MHEQRPSMFFFTVIVCHVMLMKLHSTCNLFVVYMYICDFALKVFRERETDLHQLSKPLSCRCFATSIWDETLYKVMLLKISAWDFICDHSVLHSGKYKKLS